ncbi:MAG: O-antigen ligase family protein [Schleiferiaceae bacterium]
MERQIIPILVRLAAICMPWWDLGTGVLMALAALLALVGARGRWRPLPVDVALWAGFAAVAASGLWTEAPSWATLLRWAPLLWIPLALRRQHRAWNEGLIAGGLLLSLVLLGYAAVAAFQAQSWDPLFYRDFASLAHQHSYLTLYLGLAAAALATDLRFRGKLRPVVLGLFAVVAVLAGSRMALGAVVVGGLWWYSGRTAKRALQRWAWGLGLVLVLAVALVPSERSLGKLTKADPYWATGSVDTRVVQAKAAWAVIGTSPLRGVGVDRVLPELEKVYSDWNYRFGLKRRLNVHNQFLQLWAGIGLLGASIWALGLAYCARRSSWNRGAQALAITLVLMLLAESMLERALGVVLVASAIYQSLPRRIDGTWR